MQQIWVIFYEKYQKGVKERYLSKENKSRSMMVERPLML